MVKKVKELIRSIFVKHWQRKTLSALLAIVIWIVVNHSLTTIRIIGNVSVRIVNLPQGKTVEGMQSSGLLAKKISLTLSGNKTVLDALSSNDLEVVIDASDSSHELPIAIDKKNIVSLNPEIDLKNAISRVSAPGFVLRPMKLVVEKIPIIVTNPIGEAPRGYQFLDVFPYRLFITVSGPEKMIKRLRDREIRLTFNLHEITRSQLDNLAAKKEGAQSDEVSFLVPDAWKQVSLPMICDTPIAIDDPDAKFLRIDFIRRDLLPLDTPLPVSVFYPLEFINTINPTTLMLQESGLVEFMYKLPVMNKHLSVKGVSRLFLDVVKEHMQILIIAEPSRELSSLPWTLQFINPKELEDKYVKQLEADASEDTATDPQSDLREEYSRNRFRSYMMRMRLFNPDGSRFQGKALAQDEKIYFFEGSIQNDIEKGGS